MAHEVKSCGLTTNKYNKNDLFDLDKHISTFATSSSTPSLRHIRLSPHYPATSTLAELAAGAKAKAASIYNPVPIRWLPDAAAFYSIPGLVPLSSLESYEEGRVAGMER